MVDSSPRDGHSLQKNTLNRLKSVGMTGFLVIALGACANQPQRIDEAPRPVQLVLPAGEPVQPTVEVNRVSPQTQQYIQAGKNMVTEEDRAMFRSTTVGLDLPFFYNERVRDILRIPDIRQRVLAAVGYLDVEHNDYFNSGVYSCNLYGLTVTRLLLGDDIIGSRYLKKDGTPWVLGRDDGQVDWNNQNSIRTFNNAHPALDGNNLDGWLAKYGSQYGWKAASEAETDAAMKTGEYIALVATATDYVQKEEQRLLAAGNGELFYGHVAVLVPGGKTGEYGVSQATNNYTFRPLEKQNDPIFNPEFHTYLIKVPQKSWIDARLGK